MTPDTARRLARRRPQHIRRLCEAHEDEENDCKELISRLHRVAEYLEGDFEQAARELEAECEKTTKSTG